jgi:DNA-binding response OmpR family regulator
MKILMADDNALERRVLQMTLDRFGYPTVVCKDGEEAWQALEATTSPIIAILDWMMPGLDGVEVCRKVRKSPNSSLAYIVLLTSRDGTQNLVDGLDAGADDYIKKPFNSDELKARLQVGTRVLGLQETLRNRVAELEDALKKVKTLQRLLPICSYCKKVRNDGNYWQQVDQYVIENSNTRFSHGFCPECYEKHVKVQLAELMNGQ